MMKFSPLLAFAVLAVACQPDLPPVPQAKDQSTTTTTTTGSSTTATTATQPATTTTTTGTATSSTTGATASTATTTTPQKETYTDSPRRIHHLKDLQHGTMTANGNKLDVWYMDDESKQQEGMMWLTDKDVKDNQGMLFIFQSPTPQSFWMQNTLIPLDIIYMDAKGKVLNVVHGKPKDETALPSTGPAQYVLELKDGMAAKYGIKPGTSLTIPPDAKYNGQPANPGGIDMAPQG